MFPSKWVYFFLWARWKPISRTTKVVAQLMRHYRWIYNTVIIAIVRHVFNDWIRNINQFNNDFKQKKNMNSSTFRQFDSFLWRHQFRKRMRCKDKNRRNNNNFKVIYILVTFSLTLICRKRINVFQAMVFKVILYAMTVVSIIN